MITQTKRADLANGSLLNYADVFEVKYAIYRLLFNAFVSKNKSTRTERYKQFSQFKQQQGAGLTQFAEHQISLLTQTDSNSNKASTEVDFVCYLQFIASEQLALCQLKAKSVGMLIGLVRDMAVGASPNGAEVQQNSGYFCQQASIGAPARSFCATRAKLGINAAGSN